MRRLKKLWINFLFWGGFRDPYEWCSACKMEERMFDDTYGSNRGYCASCLSEMAEARAESREDR